MLEYKLIVCVCVCFVQGVVAKPKAASKAPEKSQLDELAASAQAIVKNVTETLKGDLPDSKQVVETLNTNAQTLATSVQSVVDKIKLEVNIFEFIFVLFLYFGLIINSL